MAATIPGMFIDLTNAVRIPELTDIGIRCIKVVWISEIATMAAWNDPPDQLALKTHAIVTEILAALRPFEKLIIDTSAKNHLFTNTLHEQIVRLARHILQEYDVSTFPVRKEYWLRFLHGCARDSLCMEREGSRYEGEMNWSKEEIEAEDAKLESARVEHLAEVRARMK